MADVGKSRGGFRNPHQLPVKTCIQCARPFTWRKKWAANWPDVRYCSEACRKLAPRKTTTGA
jgi:hypothetical protein